ncbi:hypothetical protein FG379_003093 [Cryptosporidium bovis]|uniref:uncharacterized protein n=1 Tax=Cryptosporidium bovis TaxID=310047 RepID=UPI00351A4E7D|nr:hypothetical protein FG379_003093 [Cryptosporidium bovis]
MSVKNKKTILSLLFFGYVILNNVNCQKEEKTNSDLRSLGHKRTIVEPYYVDKPVLVEQPVYYPYPYPYPYQYPYSFTYQYPYAYSPYSNYPYNYSYSYSRITRPATGAMPPYPPPPPYLRYLGEKQESDEKDNDELIANQREDQELIGDGSVIFPAIQQGENFVLGEQGPPPPSSSSPSPSPIPESGPVPIQLQQQPEGVTLEPSILMKKIETNNTNGEFNINTENNNRTNELPEVIFYNNSSELRMLGKKNSIIDRVEKTVDRVLDRIKIGNYNDDNDDKTEENDDREKDEENEGREKDEENEDREKDEVDENKKKVKDNNKAKENKDGNLKKNDGKNNKNVIKQVFSKIEDIVTNTVN